MFAGQAVQINDLGSGMYELVMNLTDSSVNKLNELTLSNLDEAVSVLESRADEIKGILITSAKSTFIVGADITEFVDAFKEEQALIKAWAQKANALFCRLENLPFPSVATINGLALGGGFELALCADLRVIAEDAKAGFPEVTLGICPGFGGTVRSSRLAGCEASLAMMTSGKPQKATDLKALHLVDRIVPSDSLKAEAIQLLQDQIAGAPAFAENRTRKQHSLSQDLSHQATFVSVSDEYRKKLDPNYPAALEIVKLVLNHASLPFQEALDLESSTFASLAKTDAAAALVGLFLNDQLIKKKAKQWKSSANAVQTSAVLGAGIMGGGVAYQSAVSNVPILMKDIREDALELGTKTAGKLLDKLINKGRLDDAGKESILEKIQPTLSYDQFNKVDLVVEAVVENPAVKSAVLAEVEAAVSEDAVLTSNTSTISIDFLAQHLKRPSQFCGMHFFNPVHVMPLVEVICGKETSDSTIATTVTYATEMGKFPIVVNDCPGFLVNRVLFPYFNGFNKLLQDGIDFERIDQVMENFGWPMGPAYLADVIGIDTMVHADHVLQKGFPDRMGHDAEPIMDAMLGAGSLGQKNGKGFYEYNTDDQGIRTKVRSAVAQDLISQRIKRTSFVTDAEIIERMMIPMCTESIRCLEEGIVESAAEVDMGTILGLGFPKFRGGPLRYVDTLGLQEFANMVERHSELGGLYQLTEQFYQRINQQQTFF